MIRRTLLPALALTSTLAACGNKVEVEHRSGLWVIRLAQATESEGDFTCSENFTDASCREDGGGEYTTSGESAEGDSMFVVEILVGPDGNHALFYDGMIFPGTVSETSMVFTVTRSENATSTTEHESGTYVETTAIEGTITETFSLSKPEDAEEDVWSGTWTRARTTTMSWTQTDEWDNDDFDVNPPLSNPFSTYLEPDETREDLDSGMTADDLAFPNGFVQNTSEAECSGSTCTLEISEEINSTAAIVSAWMVQDVPFVERGEFTEAYTPGGVGAFMGGPSSF